MKNSSVSGTVNNVHYTFKGFRMFNCVYLISNGYIIREVEVPILKRNEFLQHPEKWLTR